MRIGLVTTSFPCETDPVAGGFVLSLGRALVRAGHSIDVLAPEPHRGATLVREHGIEVHHVRYAWPRSLGRTFYGAGAPDNVRSSLAAWPGLLTFPAALAVAIRVRAPAWDAVVSHWALPSGLAVALAAPHVPHVAFLHSADVHLLERLPGGAELAARVARKARALAFASRELRARFERLAATPRGAVVPIGTDEHLVDVREQARARTTLGVGGLVALALCRQVPVKGLDVAIDATSGTRGITLVLAGDGPERDRLVRRAAALGAGVRFPGTVLGADRRLWLAAADVVVVPSRVLLSGRTEGAPTVVFEALAAGVPVIASDVGGLRETVDATNGIVLPAADAGALRRALEELASDRATLVRLRRGAAATPARRPDAAARFVLEALGGRVTARRASHPPAPAA